MRRLVPLTCALVACADAAPSSASFDWLPGDAGKLSFAVVFSPDPPVAGPVEATLSLQDADGAPVEDAVVTIAPYMPAHAHGASDVEISGGAAGNYATGWSFAMPGTWEITWTAWSATAGEDTLAVDVDVR